MLEPRLPNRILGIDLLLRVRHEAGVETGGPGAGGEQIRRHPCLFSRFGVLDAKFVVRFSLVLDPIGGRFGDVDCVEDDGWFGRLEAIVLPYLMVSLSLKT